MTRRIGPVILATIVLVTLAVGGRTDGPATDAERVEQLTEQLRCPVCDGLAVADSPSSTARAIAADVRSRIAAGESDDDVRNAYVAQYGEWILLEPPAGGIGTLAWVLPVALVVGGAGLAAWTLRRRAITRVGAPSPSGRAAVAAALANEADR